MGEGRVKDKVCSLQTRMGRTRIENVTKSSLHILRSEYFTSTFIYRRTDGDRETEGDTDGQTEIEKQRGKQTVRER